jgi:hypothetical protein
VHVHEHQVRWLSAATGNGLQAIRRNLHLAAEQLEQSATTIWLTGWSSTARTRRMAWP